MRRLRHKSIIALMALLIAPLVLEEAVPAMMAIVCPLRLFVLKIIFPCDVMKVLTSARCAGYSHGIPCVAVRSVVTDYLQMTITGLDDSGQTFRGLVIEIQKDSTFPITHFMVLVADKWVTHVSTLNNCVTYTAAVRGPGAGAV